MIDLARSTTVEALLARVPVWAESRPDVRAVALVGSWACARPRDASDVDLVLLTTAAARYTESDEWLSSLGGVEIIGTQRWGVVTERRFMLSSGVEVDLCVGATGWASVDPIDPGTRRVVEDGMRPVYDPDGLLDELPAAVARR